MNTIYTDEALNNLLWHRRTTFVLTNGFVFWKFDKKKKAIKFRKNTLRDSKSGWYLIRMHPNTYKPSHLCR